MSEIAPMPFTFRLPPFKHEEIELLSERVRTWAIATLVVRLELSRMSTSQSPVCKLIADYLPHLPNYLRQSSSPTFCEGAAHAHHLLRTICSDSFITPEACETRQQTNAPDIDVERAFITAEALATHHSELAPIFKLVGSRENARSWRLGFGFMLLMAEDTLEIEHLNPWYSY